MLIRISLTHILESSGIPDPAPKQLRIKCIIELPNSQYCPLMGEIGGMSILYGQKLCEPNSTWKSTHEKTTTNTFTIMHCLKPPRDQTDCTGHVPEKGSFQVPCYMNVVGGRLCIILDCPQQPQRNIMSVLVSSYFLTTPTVFFQRKLNISDLSSFSPLHPSTFKRNTAQHQNPRSHRR